MLKQKPLRRVAFLLDPKNLNLPPIAQIMSSKIIPIDLKTFTLLARFNWIGNFFDITLAKVYPQDALIPSIQWCDF